MQEPDNADADSVETKRRASAMIRQNGSAAMDLILEQITSAVRVGDDDEVNRLDRTMRCIEERLNGSCRSGPHDDRT